MTTSKLPLETREQLQNQLIDEQGLNLPRGKSKNDSDMIQELKRQNSFLRRVLATVAVVSAIFFVLTLYLRNSE